MNTRPAEIQSEENASVVRLAVIGCGAITELNHLPAAKSVKEVQIVALVDRNIDRAEALAGKFGVGLFTQDYHPVLPQVDGVIVALPNYLHAPVTLDCLAQGKAVLVEKPMALNESESSAMLQAAGQSGAALQVALMYRFSQGARLVKKAIEQGWLGELKSFSAEWGLVYDWPVASGFVFDKAMAGGGQLVDMGSHVLDLVLWWLGQATLIEYRDDSMGGMEADCTLSLVMHSPAGPVPGSVTLSRLRNLGTSVRIVGDRFTIQYDMMTPDAVSLWPTESDRQKLAFLPDRNLIPNQTWDDIYAGQLRAFAQVILSGAPPVVSGQDGMHVVALIERCYRERQPLPMPWLDALPGAVRP